MEVRQRILATGAFVAGLYDAGDFALTGLEAGGILRHPGRPCLRRILRIGSHPHESWKTRQTVVCRILFVNERSTHSPLARSGRRGCSCLQFAVRRGLRSFPVTEPEASSSGSCPGRTHNVVSTERRPVPTHSLVADAGWGRCQSERADAGPWTRMPRMRPGTTDRVTGR